CNCPGLIVVLRSMSLQHFSYLSRQRRMVRADHRKMIPDHRNDLQSSGEKVVPALAVVVAQNGIAIDLVGTKKHAPAVQAARPVRIADPFIHPAEHSPGQGHTLLVENGGKLLGIQPQKIEERPYPVLFLSEQPPRYAPEAPQAGTVRRLLPVLSPLIPRDPMANTACLSPISFARRNSSGPA